MLVRSQELEQLKEEFSRYYFSAEPVSLKLGVGFNLSFSSFFNGVTYNRNQVSPIIDNLVYLSNLPSRAPFSTLENKGEENVALVVSCMDIEELAQSDLLLEPNVNRVKYHVVAMQDVTARVGSVDHIYDALALMSHYADCHKPIHIHCYSGVGRSAMMTALHLSHRYLLDDPVVTSSIDAVVEMEEGQPLNRASDNFLDQLYDAVSRFVVSRRRCCQFDNRERNTLALTVLTTLINKIQNGSSIVGHRDENYCFLAALAQSPEFKKFQHHYYKAFMLDESFIHEFFNAFLLNQEGWYAQLVDRIETNPVDVSEFDLTEVKAAIDRLAEQWPRAIYSLQPADYKAEYVNKNETRFSFT